MTPRKSLEAWGATYSGLGFDWMKTNADGSPATGSGYLNPCGQGRTQEPSS
jgi:hypothetical protein